MKKFLLIILYFFILFYSLNNTSQKSYPVFQNELNTLEEFSNDENCLKAVRKLSTFFPSINSVAVSSKNKDVLCGISTDNKNTLSEENIKKVLYNIFPETKNLRIEINTKRAEDIIELSYLSKGAVKKKHISSRFDFLISED